MTTIILGFLGLCFGSFVNALVWRLHQQEARDSKGISPDQGVGPKLAARQPKSEAREPRNLSIMRGRSMCPDCKHTLAGKDLVPLLSWLSLGGKCRYCKQPIAWQYPLVEAATALLFILSYAAWPFGFGAEGWFNLAVWLLLLVGFVALVVYDLHWMLLPNRIVFPLMGLAAVALLVRLLVFDAGPELLVSAMAGVLAGGGIFWLLFQASGGRWIGGGDVKLGALLGLVLASPVKALLMIFVASALGSLVALPMLVAKRANGRTQLPFGPFLIIAAIIVHLFGAQIIAWYLTLTLGG